MAKTENTIVELAKNIGKEALWSIRRKNSKNEWLVICKVRVVIKNVELFYGDPFYIVEPVAGEGQARVRDGLEIL